MAKFRLVTTCRWVGTEQYHEIEGEYENEEEALDAFGGEECAYDQALEDHSPEYYIEKTED